MIKTAPHSPQMWSLKNNKRLVCTHPELLARNCKLVERKKFGLICFPRICFPRLIYCDQEPLLLLNVTEDYFSGCTDIEDITRWREDMNFMFSWQEQYLTSERSERVRYCSCHENIKFISSSQRVMFFLLYGETNSTKAKGANRDVIERYDTRKGDIRKIRHSGPG